MPFASPDTQRHGLCVIVPYRARLSHLKAFVPHLREHLAQLPARILVVEQADDRPFNRGRLLNVGFDLVRSSAAYICFHDVDMLPTNATCDYSAPLEGTQAWHLAGCVEQFGYAMPYPEYIGGVLLIRPATFVQVNGFSNDYWGWGNEDDDLYLRLAMAGVRVTRMPGRYRSLDHERTIRPVANRIRYGRTVRRALDSGALDPVTEAQVRRFPGAGRLPPCPQEGLDTLVYSVVARQALGTFIGSGVTAGHSDEVVSVTL